jgi:hypothetical protein
MSQVSINKRELVDIHKVLEAFVPIIRSNKWETIQILTDNTTACYIINRLSAADTLYHSLRRLLSLTDILNIQIFSALIQRLINKEKGPVFTSRKHGDVSPEEQAYNDADCVRLLLKRNWILF